jgi:hypothetical protein
VVGALELNDSPEAFFVRIPVPSIRVFDPTLAESRVTGPLPREFASRKAVVSPFLRAPNKPAESEGLILTDIVPDQTHKPDRARKVPVIATMIL